MEIILKGFRKNRFLRESVNRMIAKEIMNWEYLQPAETHYDSHPNPVWGRSKGNQIIEDYYLIDNWRPAEVFDQAMKALNKIDCEKKEILQDRINRKASIHIGKIEMKDIMEDDLPLIICLAILQYKNPKLLTQLRKG
jgi:hypothetical protein